MKAIDCLLLLLLFRLTHEIEANNDAEEATFAEVSGQANPTIALNSCKAIIAVSDKNRDDFLTVDEYVGFCNRLAAASEWEDFEELPQPLKDNYNDLVTIAKRGTLEIYGSKPIQRDASTVQLGFLEQLCKNTKEAINEVPTLLRTRPISNIFESRQRTSSTGDDAATTAVEAKQYGLLYELPRLAGIPSVSDFDGVHHYTDQWLDKFIIQVHGGGRIVDLITQETANIYGFGNPVRIDYKTAVTFSSTETDIPRQINLDLLVQAAFTGQNLQTYLDGMKSLPEANVFRQTTQIVLATDVVAHRDVALRTTTPATTTILNGAEDNNDEPIVLTIHSSFVISNQEGLSADILKSGGNRRTLQKAYTDFVNDLNCVITDSPSATTNDGFCNAPLLGANDRGVHFEVDSPDVYLIIDSDCSATTTTASAQPNDLCQTVFASYVLEVSTGDNDLDHVYDLYVAATAKGIDDGLLQIHLTRESSPLMVERSSKPVNISIDAAQQGSDILTVPTAASQQADDVIGDTGYSSDNSAGAFVNETSLGYFGCCYVLLILLLS